MRRSILIPVFFTLTCYLNVLYGQTVEIPDPIFRHALLFDQVKDTDGDGFGDEPVDSNGDGLIQLSEALDTVGLNLVEYGMSSMEGLNAFENLTYLRCSDNNFIELDLSGNLELTHLYCSRTNLSSIDLTLLEDLQVLHLSVNSNLTNLDLSQNQDLVEVWASSNSLETVLLDNPSLEVLYLMSNELETIDISQCPSLNVLWASGNRLNEMDISQNSSLEHLWVWNNQIPQIDLTLNSSLVSLYISGNLLSALDVSQNPLLTELVFSDNYLSEIAIDQNPELIHFWCDGNRIESLDCSNNPILEVVQAENNSLTELDVANGNNEFLYYVIAEGNPELICIKVDDVDFANNNENWRKDEQAIYSIDCLLNMDDAELKFGLYPNPATNRVQIESTEPIDRIKLYDVAGQLVLETKRGNQPIELGNLTSGLYFVRVEAGSNRATQKLIIR